VCAMMALGARGECEWSGEGLGVFLCLVVGAACCRGSLALVKQGDGALVERLGRFHRQLGAGLHVKLPVLERVAVHTSMRERVLDVPAQSCISKDNAPLKADAVIFYRIRDLRKAMYAIDDFRAGLQDVVLTQLRTEIGQMTLDSTFAARVQLNAILLREANAVTTHWGIEVVRVEVRDIWPSPDIVTAMEMQLAAERKKRAAILESEGQRQADVNAAEARRDAVVLAAEGERRKLEEEARGISSALDALAAALGDDRQGAATLMLERARIAANHALANSPNAKVVALPASDAAYLGSTLGLAATSTPAPPESLSNP